MSISTCCPYHTDQPANIHIPESARDGGGWNGWLSGCCGLPAWVCPRGVLQPIEAHFCVLHGEPRPHPERMVHEVLGGERPKIVRRSLELAPASDGLSSPCIAGNILVYLTETGRLVAVDLLAEGTIFLAENVLQASLRLDCGLITGALRIDEGVRYLAWDVRDLREALFEYQKANGTTTSGAGSHLLGLPHNNTRLHVGSGLVRLVVVHDPIEGKLAEIYRQTTGVWPGPWLIQRTLNPHAEPMIDINLRPQDLWQVPSPVPGGVLLLGSIRSGGALVSGALLLPTVGTQR